MCVCYSSQFCLFCFHYVSSLLVCFTLRILDFPSDSLGFVVLFLFHWLRLVFNNLVSRRLLSTPGNNIDHRRCVLPRCCGERHVYKHIYVHTYGCVHMQRNHCSAYLPIQLRVVLKVERKIVDIKFGKALFWWYLNFDSNWNRNHSVALINHINQSVSKFSLEV